MTPAAYAANLTATGARRSNPTRSAVPPLLRRRRRANLSPRLWLLRLRRAAASGKNAELGTVRLASWQAVSACL
jgi:hypothetical protein